METIGQPGQRVMVGEKADASVSLFHLCFTIPRNCGNGEGEAREEAKKCGSGQERVMNILALLRFIHVGRNDRNETTIGLDRNVCPREECRPVGRTTLPDVDDWLSVSDRSRRIGAIFGQVDERDLFAGRHEL